MKHFNTLTIIVLFLGLSETAFSQSTAFGTKRAARSTSVNTSDTVIKFRCGDLRVITDPKEMPLIVINKHLIPPELNYTLRFINPDNFSNVKIYQKDDSISKSYGDKGNNGVMIIKLKQGKKLLTLEEVLKKHNIDMSDRGLPVCINKYEVEFSETLLFDLSTSFTVEVISDYYWANGKKTITKDRFINIMTDDLR